VYSTHLCVLCYPQGRDPPVLPVLQELPPTFKRTVGRQGLETRRLLSCWEAPGTAPLVGD